MRFAMTISRSTAVVWIGIPRMKICMTRRSVSSGHNMEDYLLTTSSDEKVVSGEIDKHPGAQILQS